MTRMGKNGAYMDVYTKFEENRAKLKGWKVLTKAQINRLWPKQKEEK